MGNAVMRQLEAGFAAQQSGRLDEAERCYRQVLTLERDNVHALNLLGVICTNTQRSAEAVGFIERALRQTPDNPQSHANIGLAYKDLGDLDAAVRHLSRSTQLEPANPVVLNNLGNVLRAREEPRAAVEVYERALKLDPRFAECWSNLAAALNEAEEGARARQAIDRALALDPRLAQAHNNLGDILLAEARYEEALAAYTKATSLSPRYAAALINMARTQRDMDRPDDAVETLEHALTIEPGNPEAHHVMGVLREQMGDREAAAQSFRAATEAAPEMTVADYYLAQIKGRGTSDDELAALEIKWQRDDLTSTSRMYLAFALSRALEERGEYDEAFRYLSHGNRIKADARPYDDIDTAKYMDSLVESAARTAVRLPGGSGISDTRPVFVLGMPRSGTSLTEQLLASHPDVSGAGELSYAYDTVHRIREMTGEAFPGNLDRLDAAGLAELGQYYLSRHSASNLATRYVVDKTPLNFQYIGVLALALPGAKFFHCRRDPIANCHAIHRMPFDDKQTYAHSLASLGKYYTRYFNLMANWKDLFGERIMDVSYEDTVADVETQARRMLDFLELPFDASVLEFHKTRRLVKTPSASQVREPIYTDSVAAWRRFEKHLGPLIDNLQVPHSLTSE